MGGALEECANLCEEGDRGYQQAGGEGDRDIFSLYQSANEEKGNCD